MACYYPKLILIFISNISEKGKERHDGDGKATLFKFVMLMINMIEVLYFVSAVIFII